MSRQTQWKIFEALFLTLLFWFHSNNTFAIDSLVASGYISALDSCESI